MNFANNVIIRDASGIFRSKREVIDLASGGAIEGKKKVKMMYVPNIFGCKLRS